MNASHTRVLRPLALLPLLLIVAACGKAPEGLPTTSSTQPATAPAAGSRDPATTSPTVSIAPTLPATTTAAPAAAVSRNQPAGMGIRVEINPLDLADPADAAGRKACRALMQTIQLGPLAKQPLRGIVAELRRATQVDFTLLPRPGHGGASADSLIFLPAGQATVQRVLEALPPDLEWTVHEGRIVIGSYDEIHNAKYYVTRRYDVSFVEGDSDLAAVKEELLDVIKNGSVAESDFIDGGSASARVEHTTLIITHTAWHQARIKALIEALRIPMQPVQVRYDARDLLTAAPGSGRDAQVARLLKVMRSAAGLKGDPERRITEENGTLVVTGLRSLQQTVARCLRDLRSPVLQPPPSPP